MNTTTIIKTALFLTLFLTFITVFYLFVAFATLHIDFRLWSPETRTVFVFWAPIIAAFTALMIINNPY